LFAKESHEEPLQKPELCTVVPIGYDICYVLSNDEQFIERNSRNKSKNVPLDFRISWRVNGTHIRFLASANTQGWLGIGWSTSGSMNSGLDHPDDDNLHFGDLIVFFMVDDRHYVHDCYSHRRMPILDQQQDVHFISGKRDDWRLTMEFERALNTNDTYRDFVLSEDVLPYFLWASSNFLPLNVTLKARNSFRYSHEIMAYFLMTEWIRDHTTDSILSTTGSLLLLVAIVCLVFGVYLIVKTKGHRESLKGDKKLTSYNEQSTKANDNETSLSDEQSI